MDLFFKKVYSNIERPKKTKEYYTNIGVMKFDLKTNSFYSKTNDVVDHAVKYWFKELKTFDEYAKPMIAFLSDKNPHTTVITNLIGSELLEGVKYTGKIVEFLKD